MPPTALAGTADPLARSVQAPRAGPRLLGPSAMAILMVCCIGWGVGQVAIKVSNAGISPILGAGLRSLVAVLLLVGWCAIRGIRLFERDGSLGHGITIGILFGGEFIFLYLGLMLTTASHSVIFLYTAPLFVAVGAHLFLPEPLSPARVAGLALAFIGIWLAVADGLTFPSRRELLGDLMALIGAFLWAVTTLVIKRRGDLPISPQKTLFYQLAVSAVLMIALSFALRESGVTGLRPLVAAAFLYQAVVIAFVSYLAWFWLLTEYRASDLAAFSFWTPIFGILAGGLLLGERITPLLGGAAALVAAGLFLVNRSA
ncbi:MAG TPA: DMT family transporter [Dehalococcoidia bacterium]|nr:DMT family transporter [Dehalococcoidia bacterium]